MGSIEVEGVVPRAVGGELKLIKAIGDLVDRCGLFPEAHGEGQWSAPQHGGAVEGILGFQFGGKFGVTLSPVCQIRWMVRNSPGFTVSTNSPFTATRGFTLQAGIRTLNACRPTRWRSIRRSLPGTMR